MRYQFRLTVALTVVSVGSILLPTAAMAQQKDVPEGRITLVTPDVTKVIRLGSEETASLRLTGPLQGRLDYEVENFAGKVNSASAQVSLGPDQTKLVEFPDLVYQYSGIRWVRAAVKKDGKAIAQEPKGTHAKDGSGIYGYKGTPIQPWSAYCVHDPDRPAPKKIDPGNVDVQQAPRNPPSDAIVLFDGSDLSQWKPSSWIVQDGYMECTEKPLISQQEFGEGQLHIE